MIVCLRLEVSDAERSVLSLRTHPKALKRLATGAEMKALVAEQWAANIKPQDDSPHIAAANMLAGAKKHVYTDSGIKLKAEAPKDANEIGVPVVVSKTPLMGLRKLIHHVNCAMFSLAHARSMTEEFSPQSDDDLTSLAIGLEGLRLNLAAEHDEQLEDD